MKVGWEEHSVSYVPGVSNTYVFGGNSNWRGPIWLPGRLLYGYTWFIRIYNMEYYFEGVEPSHWYQLKELGSILDLNPGPSGYWPGTLTI